MRSSKKTRPSRWKIILVSRILLLLGLLNITSSHARPFHSSLTLVRSFVPRVWPNIAATGTVIVGALLIVLSFALARRSHAAFLLIQFLLLVSVTLNLLKGLFIIPAVASALIFAFLLYNHDEFHAKPHRTIVSRAAIVFAQLSLLSIGIGLFFIIAPDRLFGGEVSNKQMISTVFRGLLGLDGPVHFISHHEQFLFDHAMPSLGFLTLIVPILALLQSSPPKPKMTGEDELGIRSLLAEFGDRDSLGYFALRSDKSIIWSPTRKAAITYRVVGGCALASADPIGNPDAWPQVIHAFMQLCQKNGWTPAAVGCGEEAGEIWVRETEMVALEIGDEAVLHVDQYDPDNPRYRNVRQSVRRIIKQEYTTSIIRSSELTPQLRTLLSEDSIKWRGGESERGFMMGLGRIAEVDEPDLLIVTALKSGELHGILQYVPWGEKALSLDLRRRI